MSFLYRRVVRPLLFAQDSERIHDRTLRALACASQNKWLCDVIAAFYRPAELSVECFGLRFPNPVGLAAGMDKHAAAVPAWEALGFGFSELGGVTWHPQSGNPTPRLFRAIADEALINRLGFNNAGAEAMADKLAAWRASGRWPKHPVGINLGKSKVTPLEKAAEDYANSFRTLHDLADFFVINVSSPNTPNLRQLQDKAALDEILASLQEIKRPSMVSGRWSVPAERAGHGPRTTDHGPRTHVLTNVATGHGPRIKPILVKVAPDLSFEALDDILELVGPRQIAGIVATNTTITRPDTGDPRLRNTYSETGGLSGKPLRQRSTEVIRHLYKQTNGTLPIIGVGGIFNARDAWEKIVAGASLIQIYTGLVYEGPGVVKSIVAGLRGRLATAGKPSWEKIVGSAVQTD